MIIDHYYMKLEKRKSADGSKSEGGKCQENLAASAVLLLFFSKSLLFCSGLTKSNYKELNVLYEKYKNQGQALYHGNIKTHEVL